MLIDEFLADYQFVERHGRVVQADPAAIERSVLDLDVADSAVIRILLTLRGMRSRSLSLDRLDEAGFRVLGHDPGRELVIGLIGKFWAGRGDLQPFDPAGFRDYARGGYAKAAWNFSLHAIGPACTELRTETRVWCPDERTRRRFARYWRLVRPFSGWIRIEMLRLIQRSSERTFMAAANAVHPIRPDRGRTTPRDGHSAP